MARINYSVSRCVIFIIIVFAPTPPHNNHHDHKPTTNLANIHAQTNQKIPTNPTTNPLKNNQTNPHQPPPCPLPSTHHHHSTTNPHQPPPPSITHPHHHGNPRPPQIANTKKSTTKSISIPTPISPLQTTSKTHEHTAANYHITSISP